MSISENQKLRDTQQKEQIFTTVPVNCVEEDYLLSNGEAERDLKSSLTISRTASAQHGMDIGPYAIQSRATYLEIGT